MPLLSTLIRRQRLRNLLAVLMSALSAAVTLWWNAQLSLIIDAVSTGCPPTPAMISLALLTMLLMSATGFAKTYLSGCACEHMAHDLRMGYARHLALLPAADAEKLNAGAQLSRLQNEIAGASGYLNANLFQLFDDGMQFACTFIWLLFINTKLTLAANLPALLVAAYVIWSSRIIGAATERSQQAKAQMNRRADTLLALFPIVRLYDATRMMIDGYHAAVADWAQHTIHAERTKARLMSTSALLSAMPLLLLFLVGGRMVIHGALSVGTLYIFLNLSGNVSGALMNMPGYIAAFRQFSANMRRLENDVVFGKEAK